ncbi:acetate/propionate family kinase [Malikia sp.]|uniref:acetate/propionate family kinase n=1 Tax=Malikia sp. TaxID=2070706 RepID=UPI00260492A2|nr:acetate/propionate family kinase [Malikia sp.]MDD2728771.1 acetate/propionate family kinase [Malikia sp.]
MSLLLTLNAGSSSIKFALFEARSRGLERLAVGQVEGLGEVAQFSAVTTAGERHQQQIDGASGPADHGTALQGVLDWLRLSFPNREVTAVSHRVVHGGAEHVEPILLDDENRAQLQQLVPLAPLHQPHNLAGIDAARAAFPRARQVACFDTSFHRSHPFVADTFALPRQYYEQGIRRYGFHGLSYEFIARQLKSRHPGLLAGRVVVAHLGNGASMCALRAGRSVASTMGFTALDGLAMGTRCGQIDPGVLLYLLSERGMNVQSLTDLLYRNSGLKGMSGLSNDMRVLLASDLPSAREAVDYFIEQCRRELGGLVASLGGLDALVLTGGIGEHAAEVRSRLLSGLGWLGVDFDESANQAGAEEISLPRSAVRVLVLATDEERMLAEHAAELTALS